MCSDRARSQPGCDVATVSDNGLLPGPVLVGHFLTRNQVARRAGIATTEVLDRPDLLRIGGTWLEEVYFAFQLDKAGVRQSLGIVVAQLRRVFDDEAIADWLVRPHRDLSTTSPLVWLASGGSSDRATAAAESAGPHRSLWMDTTHLTPGQRSDA